ncbi:MAG TPA: hypothetical protein PLP73_01865 [Candidatus Absconditabacterales bacterium]|nr:hypothetical protein [Candidatus Absconditabacterales bacterium]
MALTEKDIKDLVQKSKTKLEALDIIEKNRAILGDKKADSVIKTIHEVFVDQPKGESLLDIRFFTDGKDLKIGFEASGQTTVVDILNVMAYGCSRIMVDMGERIDTPVEHLAKDFVTKVGLAIQQK